MPVAAAGLAEVVAADPDPLELGRRGQHPAQQLAVGGLDPGALAQPQARVGHPLGQLVAQPLQLAEIEDPRRPGGGVDAVVDLDPAEGLRQEAGQLALEAADLTAQLGPGEALVDRDVKRHRAIS